MIKISKQNNSLIVEGIDNVFYPNNGDNSYPLNSLIVVTDNSDMATFRSVATNDVLFSGLINNITVNGEAVTKDNIIQKFDAVSNSSTGGGGTVDAYTKEEADNKFASKDELTNVQTVANDADTKVDALTPRVESVETSLGNKQDTLVSGTNIKTINNQSILGEGNIEISGGEVDLTNYYTKTETDTKLDTKQNTLVSGTNIKTINGENVLGTGDIQINVPTVQTGRNGTNKNYVYSNADSSKDNDKVISSCEFINNAIDRLDFFVTYWGDEGPSKFTGVPLATHGTAGIMSGNDKIKLDSIPENIAADVSALETSLGNKQDTLVSGTNIKTINSQSILGEGNIEVSGGISDEQAQDIAKIPTIETELAQKANVSDVPTAQIGYAGDDKHYIYTNFSSLYTKAVSKIGFFPEYNNVQVRVYSWTSDSTEAGYVTEIINAATTSKAGVMSAADKTKLDSISNEWTGTQSEYDALTTKDDNIIYYVTE